MDSRLSSQAEEYELWAIFDLHYIFYLYRPLLSGQLLTELAKTILNVWPGKNELEVWGFFSLKKKKNKKR